MPLKRTEFYYPVLAVLVIISFGITLRFAFWRDDWGFFWGAYNSDWSFLTCFFHPGTIAEFVLMSKLVGSNVVWWNAAGLIFKLLASISVYRFLRLLTKSERTGKIAGILFATTPIGLESVGWSAAHVVLLDVLFTSWACIYVLLYLEKKQRRDLICAILFTGFALLSDFVRELPIFVIYFLFIVLYHPEIRIQRFKNIGMALGVLAVSFFGFLIVANFHMFMATRIMEAIVRHGWDIMFYIRKSFLAFSVFFTSVGNMNIGWLVGSRDAVGFSDPSMWMVIAGIIPGLILLSLVRNHTNQKNAILLLSWMYLFYIPNWIFNIITTPGYTNRYLVLSSVGYVGLLAVALSSIPHNTLRRVLFGLLVIIQMVITISVHKTYETFRSETIFERLTNRMDQDVPKKEKQYLFVVTGNAPGLNDGLFMSGQMPYVNKRNIKTREGFPVFADSLDRALSYLCGTVATHSAVLEHVPIIQPISLSDVYAWRITEQLDVESFHKETREILAKRMEEGECVQFSVVQ